MGGAGLVNISVPLCAAQSCHKQSLFTSHTSPVDTDRQDQWLNFIYEDNVIPSVLSQIRVRLGYPFTDCCSFTNLDLLKEKIKKPGAVPNLSRVIQKATFQCLSPTCKLKHLSAQINDCRMYRFALALCLSNFATPLFVLDTTTALGAGSFGLASEITSEHCMVNVAVVAVTHGCLLLRRCEEMNGWVETNV